MRMMMKVKVPVQTGNVALRDGVFTKLIGEFSQQWRPEAMYFVAEGGDRTAIAFFDMKDASQMVQIAEPFFMGLNAELSWTPCMNQDDLNRGVQTFTKK